MGHLGDCKCVSARPDCQGEGVPAKIRKQVKNWGCTAPRAHRIEHRRQSGVRVLPHASVAIRPAQRRQVLQHPIRNIAVRQ